MGKPKGHTLDRCHPILLLTMAYIWVNQNTTFCEDTPENRAHFERLKANLLQQSHQPKKPRADKQPPRKPVILYGYNTCKS